MRGLIMIKTRNSVLFGSMLLIAAATSYAAPTETRAPLSQAQESIDKNLQKNPDNKGLQNAAERLEINKQRQEAKRAEQEAKRKAKKIEKKDKAQKKAEKAARHEKPMHPEKMDRPGKMERPEKIDRPEKMERHNR